LLKYQYMIDRYAPTLSNYDIKNLLQRLLKITGNVAATAKAANIKRKTYYDILKNKSDAKQKTKSKVLQACLERDSEATIEFLVEKNEIAYQELLQRYLALIYDEVTAQTNPEKVSALNTKLDKFIRSHIGSINDTKVIQINELLQSINAKSNSIGVAGIPAEISFSKPEILSQKFIDLIKIFRNGSTMNCKEIANTLTLPEEFVDKACNIYIYMPEKSAPSTVQKRYDGYSPVDQKTDPFSQTIAPDIPSGLYYARKYK
jgi:hypothetical protein